MILYTLIFAAFTLLAKVTNTSGAQPEQRLPLPFFLGKISMKKNGGFKLHIHISTKMCPELHKHLLDSMSKGKSPGMTMRTMAEQALLLQKILTPEQLQLHVSQQIFGNASLICNASISDVLNQEKPKVSKLETANYDSFARETTQNPPTNGSNLSLIGGCSISDFSNTDQTETLPAIKMRETLIEQSPISETRPNRGSGMVNRLAALGMKP